MSVGCWALFLATSPTAEAAGGTVLIEAVTEARPAWANELTDRLGEALRARGQVDAVQFERDVNTSSTLVFSATERSALQAALERAGRLSGAGKYAELLWFADDAWWRQVDTHLSTLTELQDREQAVRLAWYRALAHLRLERAEEAQRILQQSFRFGRKVEGPRVGDWPVEFVEFHERVFADSPKSATLLLEARPPDGTEIYVDGQREGVGSAFVAGLVAGRYRVVMRRGTQWSRTYEVEVKAGQRKELELGWSQDRYLTKDGLRFDNKRERRRELKEATLRILKARDEARALVLGVSGGRASVLLNRVSPTEGAKQAVWAPTGSQITPSELEAIERFTLDGSVDGPLSDPRFALCRARSWPYWIAAGVGAALMTGGAIAWGMHQSPDPTSTEPQPEFLTDGVTYGRPITIAGLSLAALGGAGGLGCWLIQP